jgi:hypothetical protein
LTMDDFNFLLVKDNLLEKTQTKWFKNLSEGNISLLNQLYTLKVTDNKRELVYNRDNKLIGTKPYIIDFYKKILN